MNSSGFRSFLGLVKFAFGSEKVKRGFARNILFRNVFTAILTIKRTFLFLEESESIETFCQKYQFSHRRSSFFAIWLTVADLKEMKGQMKWNLLSMFFTCKLQYTSKTARTGIKLFVSLWSLLQLLLTGKWKADKLYFILFIQVQSAFSLKSSV